MSRRNFFYFQSRTRFRKSATISGLLLLSLLAPSSFALVRHSMSQEKTNSQAATSTGKGERSQTAKQIFTDAMQLFEKGDVESKRLSAQKFEQASQMYHELQETINEAASLLYAGIVHYTLRQNQTALEQLLEALSLTQNSSEKNGEVMMLNFIGLVYGALGNHRKGLEYLRQGLPIVRALGDKELEGTLLNNIAQAHSSLGEYAKALEIFQQSLPISRAARDRDSEAKILNNIGLVYHYLGQYQTALNYYRQVLPIAAEVHNRELTGLSYNNIGQSYSAMGQYQKALEYFQQALPIARDTGDRDGEARVLNNMGYAFSTLGQMQTALDYYNQALPIGREIGDKDLESTALNNIGLSYFLLGQNQKALSYFTQALSITRELGNRSNEGRWLNNIGQAFSSMGDRPKALDYFQQALRTMKEIGDRNGEAITLNNLGLADYLAGQLPTALDYYQQALRIALEIGDRSLLAKSLNNIGAVYAAAGNIAEALAYFNQALPLAKAIGERSSEALSLSNLMLMQEGLKQSRLAIFYGKQAINLYQSLRADIRSLDKESQQSFLHSIQKAYRHLSAILIAQGRLPEAEQVINLLKEEEYFEFVRREKEEARADSRIALSPEEDRLEKRYNEISGHVTLIGKQVGELRLKAEKQIINPEEAQTLAALEKDLEAASFKFQQFISQLTEELGKTNKADRVETVAEAQALMSDLKELDKGTVALYTIVGEDRYSVILTTPDAQVARQYSIKAAELNRKVLEYRAVLQNPRLDPLPLAQELYRILVAPIARDLEGAKAETLMWSLDGVLRYLPMAALHDGKQYLVEKYRNVIFTPASNARLKDVPSPNWRGLGLGMSKGNNEFSPLPAVADELRGIIHEADSKDAKGVLEGRIILDDGFTSEAMKDALRQKYSVVHIASHFRFQPGNETNSYLLLGQGVMTIAEIKRLTNIFDKVDLLTLSACNTATGGADAQGKEIEGFAVIAQRQGAKAVLASLWAVADSSTRLLMQEFYRLRQSYKGRSKAEALRQAQLAFLNGTVKTATETDANRSKEVPTTDDPAGAKLFQKDAKAPFKHPYFWAPFILIGNAR